VPPGMLKTIHVVVRECVDLQKLKYESGVSYTSNCEPTRPAQDARNSLLPTCHCTAAGLLPKEETQVFTAA
jgi:hypothetical protein